MSRVAKANIAIPAGVEVALSAGSIQVKGKGGDLSLAVHPLVNIGNNDGSCLSHPPTILVMQMHWPVPSVSW